MEHFIRLSRIYRVIQSNSLGLALALEMKIGRVTYQMEIGSKQIGGRVSSILAVCLSKVSCLVDICLRVLGRIRLILSEIDD